MKGLTSFEVNANGDLVISLLTEGYEQLKDARYDQGRNINSDAFMYEFFEEHTTNGWDWIQPEEIGALTSAPILAQEAGRDDDGKLESVLHSRVYAFMNYQVECPMETMLSTGKVIFPGYTLEPTPTK